MSDQFIFVADFADFCRLVDENRVGVSWTVYSEIGPDQIGSYRVVQFSVDGIRVAEDATMTPLVERLITALSLPASSEDLVLSGEGSLRRNGNEIEVDYDWFNAAPYADPVDHGSGVFTLARVDERAFRGN
ncbi:hypothetical protein [Anatilimnocola floriformis]|uniref:hypothetical protein n=1 Tax=Anatilimnocola floriformis TaxID=2948575 RepID=UPI0020C4B0D4|nr:hypothetical protein [Anatilimnocola floriformis]